MTNNQNWRQNVWDTRITSSFEPPTWSAELEEILIDGDTNQTVCFGTGKMPTCVAQIHNDLCGEKACWWHPFYSSAFCHKHVGPGNRVNITNLWKVTRLIEVFNMLPLLGVTCND